MGVRGRLRAARKAAEAHTEERQGARGKGKRRPSEEENGDEVPRVNKRAATETSRQALAKTTDAVRDKRQALAKASADYSEDAVDGGDDATASADYAEDADKLTEDVKRVGRGDRDAACPPSPTKKRETASAAKEAPAGGGDASAMPGKKTLASTLKTLDV